jgi:hypothetical protein
MQHCGVAPQSVPILSLFRNYPKQTNLPTHTAGGLGGGSPPTARRRRDFFLGHVVKN